MVRQGGMEKGMMELVLQTVEKLCECGQVFP